MKGVQRWRPSRRWLIFPPIVVGIGILAAMIVARQELPREDVTEQARLLAVVKIKPRTIRPIEVGYGTARPERIWSAMSEVRGRIVETHPELDSGSLIDADELLVRIDDTDYKLRVQQRQADLNSAQASLDELKASQAADGASLDIEEELLEVVRNDLARVKKLYRTNKAVSINEVESVEGNLLKQIQSVQKLKNSLSLYPSRIGSAEAAFALAESRLAEAKRDVERTMIRSPFPGTLSGVDLEVNQVVGQGEKLFQLFDNESFEIEAQVSLSQLDTLVPGDIYEDRYRTCSLSDREILEQISAVVTISSGGVKQQWPGTPVRISENLNESTRTFGIVIRIENSVGPVESLTEQSKLAEKDSFSEVSPQKNPIPRIPIRNGAFCEVQLMGRALNDVITVPRTAIDGDSVYIVNIVDIANFEGRLEKRKLETGIRVGNQVVVNRGLKPDDLVVVKAPVPAILGMLVKTEVSPINSATPDEPRPDSRLSRKLSESEK